MTHRWRGGRGMGGAQQVIRRGAKTPVASVCVLCGDQAKVLLSTLYRAIIINLSNVITNPYIGTCPVKG